jgi:hypothetical protein
MDNDLVPKEQNMLTIRRTLQTRMPDLCATPSNLSPLQPIRTLINMQTELPAPHDRPSPWLSQFQAAVSAASMTIMLMSYGFSIFVGAAGRS